ncbi:hypothetical protein [Streptacidiphilus carbonis]|uniref:hypothetical protein n=1 Tax=Streptacidiphilus carbonis TaxID=105422 RepID=UPI00126A5E1C|nr:hypothetical protein [Streptacidiphilus carbonis]
MKADEQKAKEQMGESPVPRRPVGDAGPSRVSAVVALTVFVVALAGGTIATLMVSVPDLAYAARWEGTPGVITVRSCAEVGALKERHRVCEGVFRSDDGLTVDPNAAISQALSPGAVVAVQRTTDGAYDTVGVAAFCGWLAVAMFGVAMAGTLVMTVVAALRRSRSRRGWVLLVEPVCAALISASVSAIVGAVS